MKTFIKASFLLTIVVLWAGSAVPLWASTPVTIFDNTTHDLSLQFNPGTLQVGDQIIMGTANSWARYITDFSFEYYGVSFNLNNPSQFSGNVQADVKFYLNDGLPEPISGYAMPGTSFWDSGWFSTGVSPTPRSVLDFSVAGGDFPSGGVFLPASQFTWTVQFRNMTAGDMVGLDLYSPPSVGQDYTDYWQNNVGNGGWQMMTNTLASSMDFAARIQAVPEPSTITFSILGGLTILTLARRLRRKE